jgi:hypothetical protein
MMERLLTILCIPAVLLLGSTEGWSLPACEGDSLHTSAWTNCFGTYTFPDGEKYVGEWKDDKYHGQGTYTYVDGREYVGGYKDGKLHGQGTYAHPDGDKYVGEWEDDTMHGQGVYYYLAENQFKGDKYVGGYKDGKKHGQGTYTFTDGTKYAGEWKDGKQVPQVQEPSKEFNPDEYDWSKAQILEPDPAPSASDQDPAPKEFDLDDKDVLALLPVLLPIAVIVIIFMARRRIAATFSIWWRPKSKGFRAWAFGSFLWALGACLYFYLNGYSVFYDDELFYMLGRIIIPPLFLGAAWFGYKRFVDFEADETPPADPVDRK